MPPSKDAGGKVDWPLSEKIREVLRARPRPQHGDNFGLWLDKFLPLDETDYELRGAQRERVLSELLVARDLGRPSQWRSEAASEVLARQRESCRLLYGEDRFREFKAELHGRLVLDYARSSTIESSLSFHATLGVPKIPGSALKGLLRAAFREDEPEELARLFGAPDLEAPLPGQVHTRGGLVLHDALPEEGKFQLDLDVLTPHFRDYYEGEGKVPPADWLSPVPHGFLTVVNTTFRIVVGVLPAVTEAAKTLDTVKRVLAEALVREGLGAKRSAGYGRFILRV